MKPFLSLSLLVLLPVSNAFADFTKITACREDTNNPPFYFSLKDTNPSTPGITIEVLEMAAKKAEVELKILAIPWERCLSALQEGRVDAAFDLSYKAERAEYAQYPTIASGNQEPTLDTGHYLHKSSYYLYTLKDNNIEWDGKLIHGLGDNKIGSISGYSILSDIETMGYATHAVSTQRRLMSMLIRNEIAAFAQQPSIADVVISKRQTHKDIIRLPRPLKSKRYYLVFNKDFYHQSPEVANRMWKSITAINRSQTYAVISSKYSK